MLKWLQDNPVGLVLSCVSGFFLFLLLLMTILASLPLSTGPAGDEADAAGAEVELPVLAENQPIDSYKVIVERPLFNQSRQPIIEEVLDEDDESAAGEEADFELPAVELMGVVITPTSRMVTLRRSDHEKSLVAYEGRPIEADFGSWKVSSINERTATLTDDDGKELHLEMKVHDASIEEPAPIQSPEESGEPGEAELAAVRQEGAEGEPLSRADEIRQRIAERREELKREAGENQQAEAGTKQPTYQEAIQSLIGRNRQQKADAENEKER
jgi:hypothetical protein